MRELTQKGRSRGARAARVVRAPAGVGLAVRLAVLGLALAAAPAAFAYVGPGAGLGVLGVVAAVLAAIVMGFFGLVMWPIRKLAQHRRAHAHEAPPERGANRSARDGRDARGARNVQRDATTQSGAERR